MTLSSSVSSSVSAPIAMRMRDALAMFFVTGVLSAQLWELPAQAAQRGGWAFFAAWALCLWLFGLPALCTELLLGRRSGRAPIEGMAALTREADATRVWRVGAWGSLLTALALMALAALLAGGGANFVAHTALGGAGAQVAAWVLPTAAGVVLVLAFALAACVVRWRTRLVNAAAIVALLLLGVAALAGAGASAVYQTTALSMADWRAAAQLALLCAGVGMGVAWTVGAQAGRAVSVSHLALTALAAQIVAAAVMMLALAPFVAATVANANPATHGAGFVIAPTGAGLLVLQSALALIAVLAINIFSQPVQDFLTDKKITRAVALPSAFAAAGFFAALLWFFTQASGVQCSLKISGVLVLLIIFTHAIFAGWAMKISHARKTLALPHELIYNAWRVAARIILPLSVLWILFGILAAALV